MDVFDKKKRSWIMSRIGSKHTKPEMKVRSMLHRMGYRFRLHRKDLPGKPDIVLNRYKKIVFIHGCFWHGHKGCPRASRPSSNVDFWKEKLDKNIVRDKRDIEKLHDLGWDILIVWECETKNSDILFDKLEDFLKS